MQDAGAGVVGTLGRDDPARSVAASHAHSRSHPSRERSADISRRRLLRGALQDQLADARGIRLALHRLHDGADDRAGRLHLAVADLLEHVGLRGECLVDRGDERAVVRDDRETARVDDLLRRALARMTPSST